MTISYVGAYAAVGTATASLLRVYIPSPLSNHSAVFCAIAARETTTPIPPGGWSLVDSETCIGGPYTLTIYLYRKDTVTSAMGGLEVTWNVSNPGNKWSVNCFAFDATDVYDIVTLESKTAVSNNNIREHMYPPSLTATTPIETFVYVLGAIQHTEVLYPEGPDDASLITQVNKTNVDFAATYIEKTTGQTTSGEIYFYGIYAGYTFENNGTCCIGIRLRAKVAPDTISETFTLALTDAQQGRYTRQISNSFSIYDFNIFRKSADYVQLSQTSTETISLTPDLKYLDATFYGRSFSDQMTISSALSRKFAFNFYLNSATPTTSDQRLMIGFGVEDANVRPYADADDAYTRWCLEAGYDPNSTEQLYGYASSGFGSMLSTPSSLFPPAFSNLPPYILYSTNGIGFYRDLPQFDSITGPVSSYQYQNSNFPDIVFPGMGCPTLSTSATNPFQFPSLYISLAQPNDVVAENVIFADTRMHTGLSFYGSTYWVKTDTIVMVWTRYKVYSGAGAPQTGKARYAMRIRPGKLDLFITRLSDPGYTYPDDWTTKIRVGHFNELTKTLLWGGIIANDYDADGNIFISSELIDPSIAYIHDGMAYIDPRSDLLAQGQYNIYGPPQGITASDALSLVPAYVLYDVMNIDSAVSWDVRWGALVNEVIRVVSTITFQTRGTALAIDRVKLLDTLRLGIPQTVVEDIGLEAALQVAVGATILQILGISDSSAQKRIRQYTIVELLKISDVLRRFFGDVVSDMFDIASTFSLKKFTKPVASETISLSADITPYFLLQAQADDALEVSDVDLLQMLFNGTVTEKLRISALYISPDGSITTWAINTRTGAVTEYQNYEFNSFAQVGHKYLGASQTGLYELDGASDDGDAVIAKIRSGYSQFNGSRYTMFKGAYLGIRSDHANDAKFYFKVSTAHGEETVYEVVAQDMQTTKVRMGKGIRSRYIAFELQSQGQDFDLDTIEFVPVLVNRRV